jgi:hypothetical protein
MTHDWTALMDRLRKYPPSYHKFLAPCPRDRITASETRLGTMPEVLKDMVQHFNGAELFDATGPLLTLFGVTTVPPLPPLEWAEDWYIDKFTPHWRAWGANRDDDWVIGMMSYGGLILFNQSRGISEWDTGERRWLLENTLLDDWIEKVIVHGEAMIGR